MAKKPKKWNCFGRNKEQRTLTHLWAQMYEQERLVYLFMMFVNHSSLYLLVVYFFYNVFVAQKSKKITCDCNTFTIIHEYTQHTASNTLKLGEINDETYVRATVVLFFCAPSYNDVISLYRVRTVYIVTNTWRRSGRLVMYTQHSRSIYTRLLC